MFMISAYINKLIAEKLQNVGLHSLVSYCEKEEKYYISSDNIPYRWDVIIINEDNVMIKSPIFKILLTIDDDINEVATQHLPK